MSEASNGEATLSWRDLRLRLANEIGPFDHTSTALRLGMVGDFGWWFSVLAGSRQPSSGAIEVMGLPLSSALKTGVLGVVPLDPALPMRWNVARYLQEAALLLGRGKLYARTAVSQALEKFELAHLSKRPLGTLRRAEQRVISIAAATLSGPQLVCCESPLTRLDDDAAEYVELALERAFAGRRSILWSRWPEFEERERALFERCDHWLTLRAGVLSESEPVRARSGLPRRVRVAVAANPDAFESALIAAGFMPERLDALDLLRLLVEPRVATEYTRFGLTLPDAEAERALFQAALSARAPLVELTPLQAPA